MKLLPRCACALAIWKQHTHTHTPRQRHTLAGCSNYKHNFNSNSNFNSSSSCCQTPTVVSAASSNACPSLLTAGVGVGVRPTTFCACYKLFSNMFYFSLCSGQLPPVIWKVCRGRSKVYKLSIKWLCLLNCELHRDVYISAFKVEVRQIYI